MNFYRRIVQWGAALMLIVLPLQYLWIRSIERAGLVGRWHFLLTNWYEVVLLLGIPLFVIQLIKRRRPLLWFEWLLLAIGGLGLISFRWSGFGFTDHIDGLRYSVIFIGFYFLYRTLDLPVDWLDRILKPMLLLLIGLAILQLIIWFSAGYGALRFMGLSVNDYAGSFPRVYASLIGPNQLGTYLAVVGLYLAAKRQLKAWQIVLVAAILVMTFSRSAWLGALVAAIVFLIHERARLISVKLLQVGLGVLATLLIIALLWHRKLETALIGARHTQERLAALSLTLHRFTAASPRVWLIGNGVGTAGPATFVTTPTVFIPENWYLQILFELGLAGLFGILVAAAGLGRYLWRRGSAPAVYALLALSVNLLFLHALSDNPAGAVAAMAILAVSVNNLVRMEADG